MNFGFYGYSFEFGFCLGNTHKPERPLNKIHSIFISCSTQFGSIFIGSGLIQIFGFGLFANPMAGDVSYLLNLSASVALLD